MKKKKKKKKIEITPINPPPGSTLPARVQGDHRSQLCRELERGRPRRLIGGADQFVLRAPLDGDVVGHNVGAPNAGRQRHKLGAQVRVPPKVHRHWRAELALGDHNTLQGCE
jgi:hypothetical protein